MVEVESGPDRQPIGVHVPANILHKNRLSTLEGEQVLLVKLVDVAVFEVEDRVMKETRVRLVANEWDAESGILADAKNVLPLAKLVLFLLTLDNDNPCLHSGVCFWNKLGEACRFDFLDGLRLMKVGKGMRLCQALDAPILRVSTLVSRPRLLFR